MLQIYLNCKHLVDVYEYNGNYTIDFNNSNRVLDEIRGYLIYLNNGWNFVGVSQIDLFKQNQEVKKIALVLESPHKSEYNTNFVPIRPANGKTGRNIDKKICDIQKRQFVKNLKIEIIYEVKIINSIQYQCSCHHWVVGQNVKKTNRKATDQVFLVLFNNGSLQNDLIDRINNYRPDIIVNACTKYLRVNNVNNVIQQYLNNNNRQILYYMDDHPSSWK